MEDTVTLAVQVNGKMRGAIEVATDADKETCERLALALPTVAGADGGQASQQSHRRARQDRQRGGEVARHSN